MEKENVVSILFGSGADTDYNAKLGSGASFSQALLQNSYKDKCKKVTGNSYEYSLIHKLSKKVYIQTILENEEKAKEAGIKESEIKLCKKYSKALLSKPEKTKLDKQCKKWYNLLMNKKNQAKK